MKKKLIKDILEFRSWQSNTCDLVDEKCQRVITMIQPPNEFPVIICWNIIELIDFESCGCGVTDKFDFTYIYLGNFPVKNVKKGTYVYQVFQTGDVCDV